MRKLSHNKKRNVGLVYEFLARSLADAALEGNSRRAGATIAVISNHLSEGCTLFPELSLHRQAMSTRGVSERLARRIVDELKAAGIRGSSRRSINESAKSALIHEMNHILGRDIFDRFRIPNYTAHASIGILLSRGVSGPLEESIDLAKVEDHLINFMVSEERSEVSYDPDATMYAYKSALKLFEGQFGQELDRQQSELLREYVRVELGGNSAPFERVFERQRHALKEALSIRRSDKAFLDDHEMGKRLDEVIAEIESLSLEKIDESVERMLLLHNLRKEIES